MEELKIYPLITELERRLPFYVTGLECCHNQEHILRRNGTPSFQWIQCYKGEGVLITGGTSYPVRQNQGMLLIPDDPHEYFAAAEEWWVDWVEFEGSLVKQFITSLGISKNCVLTLTEGNLVLEVIRKMYRAANSDTLFSSLDCSQLLYEMLLDLFKYSSANNGGSMHEQHSRLLPVFDYIDDNYHRPISIEELAKTIGVTPQHLCRLFRKTVNLRPFEYINLVRINKSKALLTKHVDRNVNEISSMVGFESPCYFSALFKRIVHMTPNSFRTLYGNQQK